MRIKRFFTTDLLDLMDGNSDILIAARTGNIEDLLILLESGQSINSKNSNGNTALIIAIEYKQTAMALKLIELGADIHLKNKFNNNALLEAAYFGNTLAIEKLLKNSADINVQNYNGETALNIATLENKTETALLLIKHGADVNILNNAERNPLMRAARWDNNILAKALIEAGAYLHIVNKDENTALSIAAGNGNYNTEITIKNAINKAIEQKKETGLYSDISEKWQKMGNERISFTGIYPEQKIKLVEIYNFAARERMTISENLDSTIKTPPIITDFNQISEHVLKKALDNFEKKGGEANRPFVLQKTTILKKISPNRRNS